MKKKFLLLMFVFFAFWIRAAFSFDIKPYVFNEGGQVKTSASFQLIDSIGEPVAGTVSVGNDYKLSEGFWDTQGTVILSTDVVVWVHDFVAECESQKATGTYLALASIPVAPVDTAKSKLSDFFGSALLDYAVYDTQSGKFIKYSEDANNALLTQKPGTGFFVKLNANTKVSVAVTGKKDAGTGNYKIALKKGWNLIGNPFDNDVSWKEALSANKSNSSVSEYMKIYTKDANTGQCKWFSIMDSSKAPPGFLVLDSVKKAQGYFIYALSDTELLIAPSQKVLAKEPEKGKRKASSDEYVVVLSARLENVSDSFNAFGVLKDKSFPAMRETPTVDDDFVSLYFQKQSEKFDTDIRTALSQEEKFTFVVESGEAGKEMTLSWQLDGGLESLALTLIDKESGKTIDMKKEAGYTYVQNTQQKEFEVVVKNKDFRVIPPTYSFFNYPNPVRGKTMLEADAGEGAQVTVQVYTLTGKYVKTIVLEPAGKGKFKKNLDAESSGANSLNDLPNGVYLLRAEMLTPAGQKITKVQKMVIVK